MKELYYSSWALDTLLVHTNKLMSNSNNSGKPAVDPISTSGSSPTKQKINACDQNIHHAYV
jgi:hypothetical protein